MGLRRGTAGRGESIPYRGRNKGMAGRMWCAWGTVGNMHEWNLHTGLAENRNDYKIPLQVLYRGRAFPFPPGKLQSSPCTPAALRT